ncbi:MAG TPA: delta-60 repeat domain-containing protein, partial [Pseudomonadales bacterium]|nr:delta-60 repeat domain-containing protein [Pseudomonadales bacterium]
MWLRASVMLAASNMVAASPAGTLDAGFNGDGVALAGFNPWDASALAVLQQPDGKIVSAGYAAPSGSENKKMVVVRYNSNGTLDTSFNGIGVLSVNMSDGI